MRNESEFIFIADSDNEISKLKSYDVTELINTAMKQSDVESETIGDDIEILEKPERSDIEKKLE